MEPDARDEIHALAEQLSAEQQERCRATPPGYNVQVYCERPQGHHGRHECVTISWPG